MSANPIANITDCTEFEEEGGGDFLGVEKWIIGVVFGLLGSIAINTGNNIQSMGLMQLEEEAQRLRKERLQKSRGFEDNGHVSISPSDKLDDSEEDEEEFEPISAGQSKVWVIGTCVFVSGSLLNFASYPFAPQSMLASLESVQFVSNLLFGKIMHGAIITKSMWFGTGITLAGTLLAVAFSSKVALQLTLDDLQALWLEPAWILYLIMMGGAIVGLHLFYKIYEKKQLEGNPLPNSNVIMPIVYSVWSALFGTLSVSQAKVLGELLAINGDGVCQSNVFAHWFTYVTIITWLLTVSVWLHRLNDALGKFNPLFIIPLLQCMFIFFAIVSGGIFFKEFSAFTAGQWCGFCAGVAIMFGGLVFLVPKDEVDDDDEDESFHSSNGKVVLSNPAVDNLPPPSPPMAKAQNVVASSGGGPRRKSISLIVKKPGTSARRKSVVEVVGHGIADFITGGPIEINGGGGGIGKSPKQEQRKPSFSSPTFSSGEKETKDTPSSQSPKQGGRMGRRRMSLAGALTVEMMKKEQKKKEKEERKQAKKRQTVEVEMLEAGFSDPLGQGLGLSLGLENPPPIEPLNKKLSFVKEDADSEKEGRGSRVKSVTGPQRKVAALKEKKEREKANSVAKAIEGGERQEMVEVAHPQQVSIEGSDEEKS
ncbi:hypothetical protein TrVE_jg9083 [Triparma verrucosa]|uniref:Magnesium transporter n=1 Tax=Triparma verrucosa TaxID=1606542 RepID=A0A9W7EWN3_9STRA|nr:hypothetical protein TrVE_jg9083 [Triparma verrucosa]